MEQLKNPKLIFMGTPEIAAQSLKKILSTYPIEAVVTQPDKPKGRGLVLTPSPVKRVAMEHGIEVLQPVKTREPEFINRLKDIKPDLAVVVAYGALLVEPVIQIPSLGCINLHSSLLPKYRGATPVQWAIINGETETGWTTFYINRGMDSGDIILQEAVAVNPAEDAGMLFERMADTGINLLMETIRRVLAGTAPRIPQDENIVSYAPKLQKSDGLIDWNQTADALANRVRGLIPWPVAYSYLAHKGQRLELRIFKAETKKNRNAKPGCVLCAGTEGLLVGAGNGCLNLMEVQLEGARRMLIQDFLRGHRLEAGTKLG